MNFTRHGFDISTYQDAADTPQVVDFQKLKDWGAEFVVIKIGQGNWIDQDWYTHRDNSLGILPRAGYWYYDNRYDPIVQAQVCVNAIKDSGIVRVWVDLEFLTTGAYSDSKYWKQFIDAIVSAGYNVGIYTRKTWWDDKVGSLYTYFGQFPFWAAQYNTALTLIPKGCRAVYMWQNAILVCANVGLIGAVESKEIDHNYWNEDFSFANEWGVVTPPPTGGEMYKLKVNAPAGLNGRGTPGGVVKDKYQYGDILTADASQLYNGTVWHQITAWERNGEPLVMAKIPEYASEGLPTDSAYPYLVPVAVEPPPVEPPPPAMGKHVAVTVTLDGYKPATLEADLEQL